MAGREYVGAGGLRVHLDDPLSPQMADQISKGHLRPVDDTPEPEAEPEVVVVDEGAQEPADDSATEPLAADEVKRPNANSRVDDWRAYAVSLGMSEDEAQASTKSDLQEWVEVAENAQAAGE